MCPPGQEEVSEWWEWVDTPPPCATCPDDDARSGGLFFEMWGRLCEDINWSWTFLDVKMEKGSKRIVGVHGEASGTPYVEVSARTRCGAVAEALLSALGKFEEES